MEKHQNQLLTLRDTLNANKDFRTIGDYTIDFRKFLGKGKYGQVYPAFKIQQYQDGKRYACKIIDMQDPDSTEMKP